MSNIHLVIGNKNYSSWSLRPWMALSMAGIPFRETVIPLDTPDTAKLIAQHSQAGRVPVLYHGRQVVWESQRLGTPLDSDAYIDLIRRRIGRNPSDHYPFILKTVRVLSKTVRSGRDTRTENNHI